MSRRRIALGLILMTVAAAAAHELSPLPKALWTRAAAEQLARRAGFGGTPDEIDALYALGLEGAVAEFVDYGQQPYYPAPPLLSAAVREPVDRARLSQLSQEEQQAARQAQQRAEREAQREVRYWWLERLVESPRPLEEKMTLFWHGHFTSGAREVRRTLFMYEQNELLRRYALGNFRDLLRAISRDRAMLVYLDNARNNKRTPNENYARELLELFTLGVGHYQESDIKAAARAFTGWSFDEHGFQFRKSQHDDGAKTFLGHTGNLDGDDIIEIILQQPACSRFLARKLLEFYVTPGPDRAVVERLAAVIRNNNYELKPVLRTLFMSRAFYDEKVRGTLIKSPVELLVGAARQLGVPLRDLPAAERAVAALGQELMQPPNVKGWDGGPKWINSATLYKRYNFVGALLAGTDRKAPPAAMMSASDDDDVAAEQAMLARRFGEASMTAARSRLEVQQQPTLDPLPTLHARKLHTADEVVDFFANALLAVPLPNDKRRVLIDYLNDGDTFDIAEPGAGQRVVMMMRLLCSTPEFQLN